MIDPLLSKATIKARLLENILEIINSNDEKFLDISVVCEDGSFLWSQFLLAAASDFFARAMQGVEVTQIVFPDLQVEDVRGILLGLLYNTVPMEAAHGNNFVNFLSPRTSPKMNDSPVKDWSDINYCLESGIVKTEIEELVDLNWSIPSEPIKNGESQLEQSMLKWSPLRHKLCTDMQVEDNCGVSDVVHTTLKQNKRSLLKVNQSVDTKTEKVNESYKYSVLESYTHKKKCGTCSTCLDRTIPDCQVCKFCLDKKSRGGPGRLNTPCIKRLCLENVSKQKSTKEVKILPGEFHNCSLCEYTGPSLRSLREHKKCKHPGEFLAIPEVGDGDLKFMCDFCNDYFMTKDDVLNHVRVYHEDRLKTWLDILKYKTNHQSPIEKKYRESKHRPNQSFRCNICEYTCTDTLLLKEHRKQSHPGEFLDIPHVGDINGYKKFKCDYCEEIFFTKDSILDHVRLQHKDDFNPWFETLKQKKVRKKNNNAKPHVVNPITHRGGLLKHFYKKRWNFAEV